MQGGQAVVHAEWLFVMDVGSGVTVAVLCFTSVK